MKRDELRARAKNAWARLRGGDHTPWQAAASVAVGLAIGVTPLYGTHLLLVLAVCVPLRLDAPLSYLAANISIPLIAPFLAMAEIEIGALLLTGHAVPADLGLVRARGAGLVARELMTGTLVFSPAMAIIGGIVTFVVTSVWRKNQPGPRPTDPALERVAERYAAAGSRATYHYVRSKLASDPVAKRVAELGATEPLGHVLDIGCGRGQLALLLLERGLCESVRGCDWDPTKVDLATRASRGLAASFCVEDLRRPIREPGDTALLIDVLHYLSNDEQDAVLQTVARAARRVVIVRELDPDRGWRSAVTRAQESFTTAIGYNRGMRVNIRPIADVLRVLEAEGFVTEVSPCWGRLPFSNVLVVARRSGSA